MAYHLDHIDVLNVKIQFQKLSPSVLAPELAAGQSSMIVLKAKESFSIEKNKYAKAYTGLILNLPRGGCGVVSPLPLKESDRFAEILLYQAMEVIKLGHFHEVSVEIFNGTKTQILVEKGTPIGCLSINFQSQGRRKLKIHLEEVSGIIDPAALPVQNSRELLINEFMI